LVFESEDISYRYRLRLTHTIPDLLVLAEERLEPLGPNASDPNETWFAVGLHSETRLHAYEETPAEKTAPIDRTLKEAVRFLTHWRVFHFHDTSESSKIRQAGYIEANHHLYSDAGNLAAMLYLYKETRPMIHRRIVAAIRHIMPVFDDFVLEPQR